MMVPGTVGKTAETVSMAAGLVLDLQGTRIAGNAESTWEILAYLDHMARVRGALH